MAGSPRENLCFDIKLELPGASDRELADTTRKLQNELSRQGHEAGVPEQRPLAHGKGDPVTVGTLLVLTVPLLVPKLMDCLAQWTKRDAGHPMKVKIALGGNSLEYEFDSEHPPDVKQIDHFIAQLRNTVHS